MILKAGLAGFFTLLTPCVYPMIPVTIAYFSKQQKTGKASLLLAGTAEAAVVANSTPLINLAAIDRLDLLGQLFGGVVVPEEVWQELCSGESAHPTFRAVERSAVVRSATITDRPPYVSLTEHLDDGKAAATTLAVELKAQWLILEEREARATVRRIGCRIIGVECRLEALSGWGGSGFPRSLVHKTLLSISNGRAILVDT